MILVADSSMDSDDTSCDDDSSWVYESESSDGGHYYSFKNKKRKVSGMRLNKVCSGQSHTGHELDCDEVGFAPMAQNGIEENNSSVTSCTEQPPTVNEWDSTDKPPTVNAWDHTGQPCTVNEWYSTEQPHTVDEWDNNEQPCTVDE